ncbi:hypothetical protein BD324DRAFT_402610 [Kockovaella imperatae]|uniref:Uncharacterized protein n=1 Tax=Kockovaella imperatae TaxID=4999 RepID=A0A1Y1UJZ4_9TREE|nr:hypothetical protein BD324DRAFT_402610 [Kockovaella imperatae]ORX37847.1 hypothetical protein BD324DRAFT_402610 [Kockovaella imperatae]
MSPSDPLASSSLPLNSASSDILFTQKDDPPSRHRRRTTLASSSEAIFTDWRKRGLGRKIAPWMNPYSTIVVESPTASSLPQRSSASSSRIPLTTNADVEYKGSKGHLERSVSSSESIADGQVPADQRPTLLSPTIALVPHYAPDSLGGSLSLARSSSPRSTSPRHAGAASGLVALKTSSKGSKLRQPRPRSDPGSAIEWNTLQEALGQEHCCDPSNSDMEAVSVYPRENLTPQSGHIDHCAPFDPEMVDTSRSSGQSLDMMSVTSPYPSPLPAGRLREARASSIDHIDTMSTLGQEEDELGSKDDNMVNAKQIRPPLDTEGSTAITSPYALFPIVASLLVSSQHMSASKLAPENPISDLEASSRATLNNATSFAVNADPYSQPGHPNIDYAYHAVTTDAAAQSLGRQRVSAEIRSGSIVSLIAQNGPVEHFGSLI